MVISRARRWPRHLRNSRVARIAEPITSENSAAFSWETLALFRLLDPLTHGIVNARANQVAKLGMLTRKDECGVIV
jgi:hypothetical protein